MNKEQFVKTLNDYLLAHGYATWESWDINYEWERYQRGRSWSNEFFSEPRTLFDVWSEMDDLLNPKL